jgi:EmrB/QacA subfamily drug resistance transporter
MPTHPQKWLVMAGIGLGVFMATLDSSIVNISLPTLVQDLNTNFATIQWVVLSYVLVLTSMTLSVARIGDMMDKKRIYLYGLTLFTIGSLLCGLAPTVEWLIGLRALQGLGATMMQAIGIAIVTEVFPSTERGRALGIIGSIVSVGIAIGPPLGGMLIGLVGWRWVFWVNVPVGILTSLVVIRYVPISLPLKMGQKFDVPGALILLVTLIAYGLGMTVGQSLGFDKLQTVLLLVGAGVGLILLLFVESRSKEPMIDLKLFTNPLFSISLFMAFLVFVVLAVSFIQPFFLELVKGMATEEVGLMLMAMPVAMSVAAPLAGDLSDRYGSRIISLVGLCIIIIGCLAMTTLSEDVTPVGFILRLVPFGIGVGFFQSPNNSAIMGSAPRDRLGFASGLLALSRTLGNATGLPLMGAIFSGLVVSISGVSVNNDVTGAPSYALVGGITGAYQIAALIITGAMLLSVIAYVIDRRQKRYLVN